MCLTYWLCCRPCCRRSSDKKKGKELTQSQSQSLVPLSPQEQQDYEDLQYLSRKREIKVTIRKGTQAGVAAGLSVMAGVIIAGPMGAVVGGALGTSLAVSIAKDVVSLNDLLEQTPSEKRHEVIRVFNESFKEEFLETIQGNPELKLLLGGASIFSVVRYMVDRNLFQNEQLEKLDGVLRRVV